MKNIFLLGSDDFNLELLKELDQEGELKFHKLYDYEFAKEQELIPIQELHLGGVKRLRDFEGSVDAIVGIWDFPISTMLPLLRAPFNLPSPSLDAVLKCEHKYWSRIEQKKIIPRHIPEFCAIDPFSEDYKSQIKVKYPYWLKPVKSVASHLGFKISNERDLEHAIQEIREKLPRFSRPFNYLLQFANMPKEVEKIDGNYCLVESIISEGEQCTLEGYVSKGEVFTYGVIDSKREGKHRSSLTSYRYPSVLPTEVQTRMKKLTQKFFNQIKYDQGAFNIEFFWNRKSDEIFLLEANTRISKSHSPLFKAVDGEYHNRIMVDLSLGRRISFPHREGKHKVAAKFMWRAYEDAFVEELPTQSQIEELELEHHAKIILTVKKGLSLSDLVEQDSYSFELANIFIGGDTFDQLEQSYQSIIKKLSAHLRFVKKRISSWNTQTTSPSQSVI